MNEHASVATATRPLRRGPVRHVDDPTLRAVDLDTPHPRLASMGLTAVCTVPEAMAIAAVSRRTIYHWIQKGWVTVRYTPSGQVRIVAASLQQLDSADAAVE